MHGFYFKKISTQTAFNDAGVEKFGFQATHLKIWNRGDEAIQFSLDGATEHGELPTGEINGRADFPDIDLSQISCKSASGGKVVWVWAWRGGE